MRLLLLTLFIALAFASVQTDLLARWQQFKLDYGKTYDSVGETKRFNIFQQNLLRVANMNVEHGEPYPFGTTQFMDLTPAEFKSKYLMKNLPQERPAASMAQVPLVEPNDLPASWDWSLNKSGIITPVKNQGQCGSCWAFSATEEIESCWALKHGEVVLAPQQIVDCDKVDSGCNGGWPYRAYAYVMNAGGMDPSSDYPYTGSDGSCKFKVADVSAKVLNWSYVISNPSQEDTTLLNFIATTAPASVCVYAEPWQYYNGGILKTGCSSKVSMIDHCVQLTGYSTISGTPVWRVRNSWGTSWGESGYITLLRGSNLCSIASIVTTVSVQ
jgi:cathepsin F